VEGHIVLSHGWSTNATQMLPLADHLHKAGFSMLLYDARGHGPSGTDGPITISKFAEDLIAAIDYLESRPEADTTRLGVVGHSMGGASAILAAPIDPRIRVLVSSSAFADPVTLTLRFIRALHVPRWPFSKLVRFFIEGWLGASMTHISPQRRISEVGVPLLLLHGDSDQFIPASNMEALYANAPRGHTERWLVSGARHANVISDLRFGPRVTEFLRNHLSASLTQHRSRIRSVTRNEKPAIIQNKTRL
jgi:alpha-beta hydrolase superfamily lysophospholipase